MEHIHISQYFLEYFMETYYFVLFCCRCSASVHNLLRHVIVRRHQMTSLSYAHTYVATGCCCCWCCSAGNRSLGARVVLLSHCHGDATSNVTLLVMRREFVSCRVKSVLPSTIVVCVCLCVSVCVYVTWRSEDPRRERVWRNYDVAVTSTNRV